MSVNNGEAVEATLVNSRLLSRTTNTSTTGTLGLSNTSNVNSGSAIVNTQRAVNESMDTVGMTGEGDATRKNYSSNNILSNGDSHKTSLGKVDAEFNASSGHAHTGGAGEGAPISAANLRNFNNFFAEFGSFTVTGAVGVDDVVTTQLTGKTSGGGVSAAGVITSAPNNKAWVRDTSSETFLEDANGQRVYGRITESGGVWTLSYYTNEAGVETAHSLTSTNITVYYLEVFTASTRPTIPSNPAQFGTLDVTADVVDATATQRGLVSTGTQTIAGAKTITGALALQGTLAGDIQADAATTGSNATLVTPSKLIVRVTNGSLASISDIPAPATPVMFILENKTGVSFNLVHTNSASTDIITPTGANLAVPANNSVLLFYDTTASRWHVLGLVSSGGSGSGVTAVSAATTVNINLANPGTDTFDTISLSAGNYLLVKNQSDQSKNGVYVFDTNATPLARHTDWDTEAEITLGKQVSVIGGFNWQNTLWAIQQIVPELDTDPVTFELNGFDNTRLPGSTAHLKTVTATGVDSTPVELWSGDSDQNSGHVSVYSGEGVNTGALLLSSGYGTNTSGSATLQSGQTGGGGGISGTVNVKSGDADNASGGVNILSGNVTNTAQVSGPIELRTGTVQDDSGSRTGLLNAFTGDATGDADSGGIAVQSGTTVDGDSGHVKLSPGAVSGAGVRGKIQFVEASLATSTAGDVWTLTDTGTGAGAWSGAPRARAYNSSTTITGSLATIVWTTEDYDTHSAFASGVFTVPAGHGGEYQYNLAVALAGTFLLNTTTVVEVQVNGTAVSAVTHYIAAAITNEHAQLSDILRVAAGDTIRVQISNSGTTPSFVNSNTRNFFSLVKVR